MAKKDPNQMGFFEHLEELRGRIGKSLILWILVFIVCFYYARPILRILAAPFIEATGNPHPFAAIDPKEPFFAHIKGAFWVSVIFSSGIFFYHVWAFVAPGLTKAEKRFTIPFLIFMALFFLIGSWFSFFHVFPYALDYLMGWNDGGRDAYTRSYYLSMLFAFVLGMGASFEMPMLIFLLAKLRLVTPKFLLSKFKYAVVIIFTIAAIITPTPDIYLQTFLALPMLVLYLIGVGAAFMVQRKPKTEAAEPSLDEGEIVESS